MSVDRKENWEVGGGVGLEVAAGGGKVMVTIPQLELCGLDFRF